MRKPQPDEQCAAMPDAAADGGPPSTIGQLATEFGVSLRTLRFYESRGLLSPRRSGSSRFYGRTDRDRLALILDAKKLGFTLREISELMQAGQPEHSLQLSLSQCTEQINLLERQKRRIETALTELRRTYSSHYLRSLEGAEASER